MDTVELFGTVFHGTHRGSVGVYTNEDYGTYAGGRKGDVAHGHGVDPSSDFLVATGLFRQKKSCRRTKFRTSQLGLGSKNVSREQK